MPRAAATEPVVEAPPAPGRKASSAKAPAAPGAAKKVAAAPGAAEQVAAAPGAAKQATAAEPGFDLARVRADFPILSRLIHGRPLAYLDNAATTQKPRAVFDAIEACWSGSYANVGRGVHTLAEEASAAHEGARETVRRFLNAPARGEVVFVRGTTEAINLVAASFGRRRVGPGDEVLVTILEHHSNLVPWQRLCAERGARLVTAPIDDGGRLRRDELERLLGPRTRIVAVAHVSNVLGTVNPVREIARLAHARGAVVVVDGAQAAPHLRLDVRELECDFYAFSGHKVYGPSGIGALWGRAELLAEMEPYQAGGGMVDTVGCESATYAPPPRCFEAGTPAIEGAVGMAAALNYLERLDGRRGLEDEREGALPDGRQELEDEREQEREGSRGRDGGGRPGAAGAWEAKLLQAAVERLEEIPGLRLLGWNEAAAPGEERGPVLSFVIAGAHPHDVATILDGEGIAVRAGHHCAQPLMARLGVAATTRASFAFYNTLDEVDALAAGIVKATEILGR